MFQAFVESFTHCLWSELITIKSLSLSALGYQLLPLATSKLVDDNRKFGVSGTFSAD